jgi:three-Cys-motif partner protein
MGANGLNRGLADDGLYAPEIKRHSLEKIRLHNAYADRFTASMRKKWPQLTYVGLYSGSGRATLADSGEIIETTAMGVFRLAHPFTKFIFVDNDERCIEALRQRIAVLPGSHDVSLIQGDTNSVVAAVRNALPPYTPGHGLLSFCFVDPFAADLRFDAIRSLGDHRMDFLILLMLGRDIRTNLTRYYKDPENDRIANLIDDPNWRESYDAATDKNIVRFILGAFDKAMVSIGYLSADEQLRHQIPAAGTSVLQYVLVFYCKHPLGQRFWKNILANTGEQQSFDL